MIKIGTFDRTTLTTPKPSKHLGKNVGWERVATLWWAVWRPKLIVVLTLLGVREDLIGLLNLFELLSVTALVWVVLAGKFVIGFLDDPVLSISGDS
jgi:hypothetical protein